MLLKEKSEQELGVAITSLNTKTNEKIWLQCDQCSKEYQVLYTSFCKKNKISDICRSCSCKNGAQKLNKSGARKDMVDRARITRQNTLIEKYGVDHVSKIPGVADKKRASLTPEIIAAGQEKYKQTCLEKYGVDNPNKIPGVTAGRQAKVTQETRENQVKKLKQTNLERYGVECVTQLPEIIEKSKQTQFEKYGMLRVHTEEWQESARERWKNKSEIEKDAIHQKRINTCLEKYGFENSGQNPEKYQKSIDRRVELGLVTLHEGKTVKEWARELGFSGTYIGQLIKTHGLEFVKELERGHTSIEQVIKDILEKNNLEYQYDKGIGGTNKFRYDFLVNNIGVEADGNFFHSEFREPNKNYHKEKRYYYLKYDIKPLFFRSDEIHDKPQIVESIILNKLNKNKESYYARKCEIISLDAAASNIWFNENHLMGMGSGKTYALLTENKIVAAIQVKRKKGNLWEISRFSTALYTSVAGGYSKLISHFEKIHNPESILTFVDLRYGSGEYLKNLGFEYQGEHLSFKWTDGNKTFNRMQFPGNSGYENGLMKIWDCGQAKWIKNIT